jgi:hypothetical protein
MRQPLTRVCAFENRSGASAVVNFGQELAMNKPAQPIQSSDDNDIHKGATEEDRPGPERSSHPGLDKNGLPNDPIAIAQDALGATEDKAQG